MPFPRMSIPSPPGAHRRAIGLRIVASRTVLSFAAVCAWPLILAAADDVPPSAATSGESRVEVDEHKDLAYYDGPDADKFKHKLDLYLPRGQADYPTVLFVHGGAWMLGDKSNFGIYAALGRMFAQHGVGCAAINYRLSPGVRHPEHVKDVARAFAWLRSNIARYGGDAEKLFVSGHSAGGHLSALLATDDSYLKAEGLTLADIRGVMAISGVYEVPGKMFNSVFGPDEAAHRKASPIEHVSAGCPPMLLIYAEHDFWFADSMANDFAKALDEQGVSAETLLVESRNHIDIIIRAAAPEDPAPVAMLAFVRKLAAK